MPNGRNKRTGGYEEVGGLVGEVGVADENEEVL